MRNGNSLIVLVTIMDLLTAILVLTNPAQLLVARLGIFYEVFPKPYADIGAILMILSAILAIHGLRIKHTSFLKRFFLFIPQQLFLLMSLSSALDFIIMQHYADGVLRPWPFILQDQLPSIVLAIGYFFAILSFERKL